MKRILSNFLFVIIIYKASASVTEDILQEDFNDFNEKIYEKYIKMDKQLEEIAEQSVKKLLPYLLEAREHVNISAKCAKNLFDLMTGFRKLKSWSFNFLDALGKIQSGMHTGNLQMFGEYEECVQTTVMKNGIMDFQGQYCSLECSPYLPKLKRIPAFKEKLVGLANATRNSSDIMKLIASKAQLFYQAKIRIGLCVPSGCTKQDISEIAKYSLGEYINTTISHCLKKDDIFFWTKGRTIVVCILVLLGSIVVLSTLLDRTLESWKSKELGVISRILQCFSLTRNFPKLMNTDTTEKSVTCLCGIRVLTIFWVILAHEYFLHAAALTANHGLNYEKMLTNFFSQIILNAFFNVDIFFFISGFVNCYTRMLIKQDGKSQPSILKIVTHRLWRIYPAYIATFLMAKLLVIPEPYLYNLDLKLIENCDLYWWRNLLFISNFFHPFEGCLQQTWYLCADMQLFLLTLFTVPILLRKPKKGIILHISIILIVNVCAMSWWFVDNVYPSTLDGSKLDESSTAKSYSIYALPVVHLGSYFIGIILGYITATKKEIKIPKKIQCIGWLLASFLFTSMLFMTLRWNSGIPYTKLESSLYGAWSRTILVLGFSWLVFCCVTGHGGIINYILSLKLWIPLSRITYMIYLLSPIIQEHYRLQQTFPSDFSEINIIWNYFADVSISILMSLAVTLIFESPFIAMEKVIFHRNEDKIKQTSFEIPKENNSSNINGDGLQENGKIAAIYL